MKKKYVEAWPTKADFKRLQKKNRRFNFGESIIQAHKSIGKKKKPQLIP